VKQTFKEEKMKINSFAKSSSSRSSFQRLCTYRFRNVLNQIKQTTQIYSSYSENERKTKLEIITSNQATEQKLPKSYMRPCAAWNNFASLFECVVLVQPGVVVVEIPF
jgi:hypothetical protein